MPRTTDFAIVAVPLVVCLALYAGLGLLNRPALVGNLPLPVLQSGAATAAAATPTIAGSPQDQQTILPQTTATAGTPASVPPVSGLPESGTPKSGTLDSGALAKGRELAALLYSQRLTALWNTFSPSVRQEWGTFQSFQAYRAGGLKAFGAETQVVSERVSRSGDVEYYTRTASFERGPRHDWTLVFGLNPARQVVAFNIVNAGVLPGTAEQ